MSTRITDYDMSTADNAMLKAAERTLAGADSSDEFVTATCDYLDHMKALVASGKMRGVGIIGVDNEGAYYTSLYQAESGCAISSFNLMADYVKRICMSYIEDRDDE